MIGTIFFTSIITVLPSFSLYYFTLAIVRTIIYGKFNIRQPTPVVPAPPIVPIVERVKKWVARKVFLLGMITTLNMPGWEPEERICLGNFPFHPYRNIIMYNTLEPLIKDPLRKVLNLSIYKGHCLESQKLPFSIH